GAIQADGDVALAGEVAEVASGAAAEVEQGEGPRALNLREQGLVVLADIVILGTFPEGGCLLLIMIEGPLRDGLGGHGRSVHAVRSPPWAWASAPRAHPSGP